MSAAWVLETARITQQTAFKDVPSPGSSVFVSPQTRKKPARASNGPVKRLFLDKHFQSNPRYQLPAQQPRVLLQSLPSIRRPSADQPTHAQNQQQLLHQSQQQDGCQQQQQQQRRVLQPKHRALAARLAAAAERQQRRQQYHHQQQQQQQASRHGTWSPKVAADIATVCAELGLPQTVAAALSAAAVKKHVSCNPGILLSQLLRLLPLEPQLSSLLGRENSLTTLLSAQPTLLHTDPQSLQANCAHLRELLGQQAAAAAVKRCPQILVCSPFRISANLTKLQELLEYSSPSAAAAVAVRQPLLLLCSADNLQLRWQQLKQLMAAISAEKLAQQLRRTPELLLMRPSTLAGKLKCLELLFAPVHTQLGTAVAGSTTAAATAEGSPGAVGVSQPQQQQQQRLLSVYKQHQLSYRLQRLQQLAQQHRPPPPRHSAYGYGHSSSSSSSSVSNTPADMRSVEGNFATLSAAAAAAAAGDATESSAFQTDPRVQHLALKVPGLLSLNPCTLHAHVIELQLLLALQPDDPRLTRLVLLQPGLLTQAPRTLANKLQLLQHLTGQAETYVLEMVLRCPAVLTLSVESVKAKWGLLQGCARACRVWQQQLAAAPPVSVAMMLCYSVQRLQRLQYVVQLSQQQQGEAPAGPGSGCGQVTTCAPVEDGSSSSSSSSVLSRHRSRGRRQRHVMPAGAAKSSSSSNRRCAPHAAAQREQQLTDLATVPWKSMIQESEAVFCSRFPGYKAWQQQQQQH